MGTKYSSISVSGYNATPPADDGSQVTSNQVKWTYFKTKIGDPLNTWIAAADAALATALNFGVRQITASDSTTAADHMKTVEVAPSVTAAVTVSLGDAATMTANYVVRVKNSGSGTVTVGRVTGTDTLDGATKNITLAPNQSITVQVNSSEDGYLGISNNPVLYDFTDPSKSARFVLSGITTATQRTVTLPDSNTTILPYDGTSVTISGGTITTGSATALSLATTSGTQVKVIDQGDGTNWVELWGRDSGSSVAVLGAGGDTNVSIIIGSQAGGAINLSTNGGTTVQAQVTHTASADRYITITGGVSGSSTNAAIGVSGGALQLNGGTGALITNSSATEPSLQMQNANASTPNGLFVYFTAASPDNNSQYFANYSDSTTVRAICYSDGDWQNHDNSYGAISDERLKANIVDANSQIEDFRQFRFRNYEFKSDIEAGKSHKQIGLIAQEAMKVSPGLVYETDDGMYALQYSVLYVKGMKALQENILRTDEIIKRLEKLEAK